VVLEGDGCFAGPFDAGSVGPVSVGTDPVELIIGVEGVEASPLEKMPLMDMRLLLSLLRTVFARVTKPPKPFFSFSGNLLSPGPESPGAV
jgi:hypothetical protein